MPEGPLSELRGSRLNWRCQQLSEAKRGNPCEELLFLFLCVTQWALFCPILSQRTEMEQNIGSGNLSAVSVEAVLTSCALLLYIYVVIDMFWEAASEEQWGLFKAPWKCLS